MAMDPSSGHVKAYVGGIDYTHFQYDHVTQAQRQVGSTFKPFVYTFDARRRNIRRYKVLIFRTLRPSIG